MKLVSGWYIANAKRRTKENKQISAERLSLMRATKAYNTQHRTMSSAKFTMSRLRRDGPSKLNASALK